MKFFLLLTTFAIAQDLGWAIPIGQQMNITRHMCFKTTGISDEILRRIEHYDYPDTKETYRYMRCVFENLELWNEENGIQDERVGEILEGQRDRSKIVNAVKECNEDSKTDDKDLWLYNAVDCIANGSLSGVLKNIFKAS